MSRHVTSISGHVLHMEDKDWPHLSACSVKGLNVHFLSVCIHVGLLVANT